MSVRNVAREKLEQGHLSLGVGIRTTRSVEIAKMMATAGFDWLFLDMEHGTMSLDAAWAAGASDQRIFILRRHRLTVAVSNETDHPIERAALNRLVATAIECYA